MAVSMRLSFLLALAIILACLHSPQEVAPVEEIKVMRGGYLKAGYCAIPTLEIAVPEETSFTATISFYSCSDEQGTADGITASGGFVFPGCAASYPDAFEFGTRLFVEGHGIVQIQDTGIGLSDKANWVDIWVGDTERCFELGIQERSVLILR